MSRIKEAAILIPAKLVAMLMQIVAIRVYVEVLGQPAFGVFDYFTVVMAYVALIELGFVNAFQREVLDCLATDRRREVPAVSRLVFKLIGLAALAGIPIYAAVSIWLPFGFQRGVHSGDLQMFAMVAWFHLAGTLMFMALNALLAGASAFTKLGILTASNGLAVPGLGIAGAVIFRTPEGVLMGMASGLVFSVALGLFLSRPFWKMEDALPVSSKAVARRLIGVGIRAYPARLSATLAGSLDRVILANVMSGVLTAYALSFRVAQFFQELLVPIYQMMFPPISAAVVRQDSDRAKTIETNILAGAALGTSFALVGSGYGLSITRLWVGDLLPGVAAATFWLGMCKASDLVANITGIAHFAQGRMDRLIPFFATNMTLTALLTALMVRWFGIGGVGAMNACLSIGLLIPLMLSVRNRVAPELRVWRILFTFVGTLMCGASIALLAAWGASKMTSSWGHAGWLLTAPVAVAVCFAIEVKLLKIPVPQSLQKRFPRAAAWLGVRKPPDAIS